MDFSSDPTAWIALSFGIFTLLLWLKGRKAILGALDSKIAVIRGEIETAQNLRLEAQNLFEDYERRHMEAVRDAEDVIKAAERQAAEMGKKAESDLAETIALRERDLEERLGRMKQSAVEEMRRYAADLAIEATSGIIAEKLDKAARDQLIDQAIKNAGREIH